MKTILSFFVRGCMTVGAVLATLGLIILISWKLNLPWAANAAMVLTGFQLVYAGAANMFVFSVVWLFTDLPSRLWLVLTFFVGAALGYYANLVLSAQVIGMTQANLFAVAPAAIVLLILFMKGPDKNGILKKT